MSAAQHDSPIGRARWITTTLGVFVLAINLWWVHRWYDHPFPVWAGWDEAYIASFAGRLLDGHGVPYVDAVSHRGPVLYWIAALIERVSDRYSWHTMRVASLLATQIAVWLSFAVGAAWRRPLAGMLASAAVVFMTAYGMAPKDGIGFNGEIVALSLTLLSTLLTVWALVHVPPRSETRVWLAAAAALTGCLAGLTKQVAFVHLIPLAIWWIAETAPNERRRTYLALCVGAATPVLSVIVFYARVGHLHALIYYFFTYNRKVYLGPVTLGYAIESSFLFARDHMGALAACSLLLLWGWSRWFGAAASKRPSELLKAIGTTAPSTIPALQATLASLAAFATFRFWDHYFISALPWLGLVGGVLIEEHLASRTPSASLWQADRFIVATVTISSTSLALLTLLWLDGQRRAGQFGNPKIDPVTVYVQKHTDATESIFVWGFAPEIYTSSARHAASRFIFTTFPAGMVPWFPNLTRAQEDRFAVPGSRRRLLRELQAARPKLIADVPASLQGRSLRRYKRLNRYLRAHYCFDKTVRGGYGRVADMYLRRDTTAPCTTSPPPLPPL